MTVRRLLIAFQTIGNATDESLRQNQTFATAIGADGTFLVEGEVLVARGDGTYEVNVSATGERVSISAVTDEPLAPNTLVWVSKTNAGTWVIHGSKKS